ncbi:septum site-determining protein MinC [Helicobacter sp. T3_23-1059]
MKTRQHNQRVIVLEEQNEEDIIKFLQKNEILLTRFVINFKSPISAHLQAILKELNLCYFVGVVGIKPSQNDIDLLNEQSEPTTQSSPNTAQNPKSKENPLLDFATSKNLTQKNTPSNEVNANIATKIPKIIHKVRSGEEIIESNSLQILGDISSGAKVSTKGSVTVFGDCYGVLEVEGEFLILRKLKSGYILFNGEKLNADMLARINANDKLKIIIKSGLNFSIKDIF